MAWRKRKKIKRTEKTFSFSEKLQEKCLSDERFEIMMHNLPLEDLISLKLELANKSSSFYSYGIPLWKSINRIVKEAIFKYALSVCTTSSEACTYLKISYNAFYRLRQQYLPKEN